MDNQLHDHETRIRYLERTVNQLDIRLREIAFAQTALSNMVHSMIPKVEQVVEDIKLADRVAAQLKLSENAGWTRRERWLLVWSAFVTTIGPLVAIYVSTTH